MDVRSMSGESGLNSGRIIDSWPAGPVLRITFVQYLTAFCSRPEATSGVISSRVPLREFMKLVTGYATCAFQGSQGVPRIKVFGSNRTRH